VTTARKRRVREQPQVGAVFNPYSTVEIRKAAVLGVLRDQAVPMTRRQIEYALYWPEGTLHRSTNAYDPLRLLIEEGLVGKVGVGRGSKYIADPPLGEQLLRRKV
jgi:hypothetical protein